jgi:micrococcal nuclease
MKNRLYRFCTLLCCILLLVGCQSATTPQGVEVKVAQVVSGQSLEVTGIGEKSQLISRVRLVGIDAPDLQQQPWGQAAKEQLEKMIGGQPVMLEFDVQDKDSFGRSLAYVWKNGVLLNELLVAQGYVLSVPRSPNHKYDQRLSRAQESARLMGQGIWNPEKPMRLTPTEFRRQYR